MTKHPKDHRIRTMSTAERRDHIGLLQVYTGDGKGKTTAALGLSLRALGAGLRVAFLQLFKGALPSSELALVCRFGSDFWLKRFARELTPYSLGRGEPTDEDRQVAAEAWATAREVILSGAWDLVVLDEVNNLLHAALIPIPDCLASLLQRPRYVDVVCTGRGAPQQLLDVADLVTEMRCLKHPFASGVPARPGIDC